jgi:hypothetical protein
VVLPGDDVADRLALTFSMVLTVVLFQNGLDAQIPPISYLTFQEKCAK